MKTFNGDFASKIAKGTLFLLIGVLATSLVFSVVQYMLCDDIQRPIWLAGMTGLGTVLYAIVKPHIQKEGSTGK